MANSIVEIILYIVCFVLSFYAISAVQFDKFCRVKQPAKVTLLMFLCALALSYLCTQAILVLTIYNGLGV